MTKVIDSSFPDATIKLTASKGIFTAQVRLSAVDRIGSLSEDTASASSPAPPLAKNLGQTFRDSFNKGLAIRPGQQMGRNLGEALGKKLVNALVGEVITYDASTIEDVAELGSETFRHSGKALAGALVGGVLTGGIGFLAGAAFGGRRRKEASFIIKLKDGNHVAFTSDDKELIRYFDTMLLRRLHGLGVK